jgi:hypothetical protein
MPQYLSYVDFTTDVTIGGDFPVKKNCNGWVAVNLGTDIAKVNGMQILPPVAPTLSGEAKGVLGNYGEIYGRDVLSIEFLTTTGPHLQITQKLYPQ